MSSNSSIPILPDKNLSSYVGPTDKTTSADTPEVKKAQAKGFAETCQKFVFSKPFTKETLGVDKLELKHKAFNVFFTTSMVVLLPVFIPMSAARLCYVAHMEAKEVKKGQESVKNLVGACKNLGIPQEEISKATVKQKEFNEKTNYNTNTITDKPLIKANNETIKALNGLLIAKRNEMDKEFMGLVNICSKHGYLKDENKSGKMFSDDFKSDMSESTINILEGKTEKVPSADFQTAIKELKEAMGKEDELKAPLARLNESIHGKIISSPIPAFDIKPLSNEDASKFESSKNAMKDFIVCGTGFLPDKESGIQVKNENINADSIAGSLGLIYPSGGDAVLVDLGNAMNNVLVAKRDDSAQGASAQLTRVLDLTKNLLELNFYNPALKIDLAKDRDSTLLKIIESAENNTQGISEFQSKINDLKMLCANLENKTTTKLYTPTEADVQEFETNMDKIRTGDFKGKDDFAKSMALDSRDIMISLTKEFDISQLSKGEVSAEMGKYFNNLTNYIAADIVKGESGKEVKRSIEFYIKFAKNSSKIGDHQTTLAILLAIGNTNVDRLSDPDKKPILDLKSSHKETLSSLLELYSPMGNFKNYKEYLKNEQQEEIIPIYTASLKEAVLLKEGNDKTTSIKRDAESKPEEIPNSFVFEKIGGILKPIIAVRALENENASRCQGFSALKDKQIDEKAITKEIEERSLKLKPRGDQPKTIEESSRKRKFGISYGSKTKTDKGDNSQSVDDKRHTI